MDLHYRGANLLHIVVANAEELGQLGRQFPPHPPGTVLPAPLPGEPLSTNAALFGVPVFVGTCPCVQVAAAEREGGG